MTEAMRIIGLAGWSGSGKTTLITKVIPRLIGRGVTVSTLKHAHHGFDLDQPGKDSFFHRTAGATEVIISSAKRFAILHELREEAEWDLPDLVAKMSPVDLVLVEGYKRDAFPKLEVHRTANGKPLIHPEDPHIVAIASDVALPAAKVPVIDLNDIEAIADMLLKHAVPVGEVRMMRRA
jgi:molybdopterin-guanine dinucleotide biosynthesis protein B